MSEMREAARFNVKAVVKETGMNPDTLRAWERRYGLPDPERTSGGHRRYSRRDIETIKWLMARQEEGLSISSAVDLWREIDEAGSDPLAHPRYGIPQRDETFVSGPGLDDLKEEWIKACLEFDDERAERTLDRGFAYYSPDSVVLEVLRAGVSEIGARWSQGEADVQQEHFATAIASRRLHNLLSAAPPPVREQKVLLACPPHEEHSFGLLVLAVLLRRRGWPIVYLGANVPLEELIATLDRTSPGIVVASAQSLPAAASLASLSDLMKEAKQTLGYGGEIFARLDGARARIVGHYLGDDLRDAPTRVEQLIATAPPVPETQPLEERFEIALDQFSRRHPFLEATLIEENPSLALSADELDSINDIMARWIKAGLKLGELSLIEQDPAWVQWVLETHNEDHEQAAAYLRAYEAAARTHFDADSFVLSWLKDLPDALIDSPHTVP